MPGIKQYRKDVEISREKALHYYYLNHERNKAASRARYHASDKRAKVLSRYGITPTEYDTLFAAQGGVCAICRQPQRNARTSFLCVDHDHETGAVRGLLCTQCNVILGWLEFDTERFERLMNYSLLSSPCND